jgi:hypothetical protein
MRVDLGIGLADNEEDLIKFGIKGAADVPEPFSLTIVLVFVAVDYRAEDGRRNGMLAAEAVEIIAILGEAGATKAASSAVSRHGQMGATDAFILGYRDADGVIIDTALLAEIIHLVTKRHLGGQEDILEEFDHLGLFIRHESRSI